MRGLGSASIAPAKSASTASREPWLVTVAESTRIGVGAEAMICSITCCPPPSGICRSRVTTSGRTAWITWIASIAPIA
jgi:hypothetical protein